MSDNLNNDNFEEYYTDILNTSVQPIIQNHNDLKNLNGGTESNTDIQTDSEDDDVFKTYREETNDHIQQSIKGLRDARNITSILINLNSRRQILIEDNHQLLRRVIKLQAILNEKKGNAYSDINNNLSFRVKNKDDKYAIVKGKIADIELRINLLNNQVNYNTESIKTIDSVLYGLKHRLEVEKIFGVIPTSH